MVSIGSLEETEVLINRMEEDDHIISEVSSIKNILDRHKYEDEDGEIILRSLLTRLHSLITSVDILKATDVEKSVDIFKKHNSKTIRDLAQGLINEWKNMKEEWQKSVHQSAPTEVTRDYADTDEFWGLPIPPLDSGAFETFHTSTMDLNTLFDGINDCTKNEKETQTRVEKLKTKKQSHVRGKEMGGLIEVYKPDNVFSSSVQEKLKQLRCDQKVCDKSNIPIRKEADNTPKKAMTEHEDQKFKRTNKMIHEAYNQAQNCSSQEKQKTVRSDQKVCEKSNIPIWKEAENIATKKAMTEHRDSYSLDRKFKSTQKRVHEAYDQVESAKKQRRIQIIDYLPMEGSCYKKNHPRIKKSFRSRIIRQH